MRKLIYSLLTVIILAVVVAPFVDGVMLENDFKSRMNKIPNTPKFSVELVSYERGWYSANAKLKMVITDPVTLEAWHRLLRNSGVQSPKDDLFMVDLKLIHGPFVFSHLMDGDLHPSFGLGQIRSSFSVDETLMVQIKKLFAGKEPLLAQTTVHFSGESFTTFRMPTLSVSTKQGSLTWEGIFGYVTASKELNKFVGKTTIAPAVFRNKHVEVSTLPMVSTGSATLGYGGLWYGTTTFKMPKVVGTVDQKPEFILEDLVIHTEQQSEDTKLLSTLNVDLKKVSVSKFDVGPSSFKLSLEKIDIDTLVKIRDMADKLNQSASNSATYNKMVEQELFPLFTTLLQKGGVLKLQNFSVKTPIGDIASQGAASLPSISPNPQQQIKEIIQDGSIDFHISVPPMLAGAWVSYLNRNAANNLKGPDGKMLSSQERAREVHQRSQTLIQSWLANGYILQDGNNYSMTVSYRDRLWKINNKVVNSVAQMMPPAQAPASPPTPAQSNNTPGVQPNPPVSSPNNSGNTGKPIAFVPSIDKKS